MPQRQPRLRRACRFGTPDRWRTYGRGMWGSPRDLPWSSGRGRPGKSPGDRARRPRIDHVVPAPSSSVPNPFPRCVRRKPGEGHGPAHAGNCRGRLLKHVPDADRIAREPRSGVPCRTTLLSEISPEIALLSVGGVKIRWHLVPVSDFPGGIGTPSGGQRPEGASYAGRGGFISPAAACT